MHSLTLQTHKRSDMVDITSKVSDLVSQSGVQEGLAVVFVPHTTSGVTINENADPDVVHDFLLTLNELIPKSRSGYRHGEGNSDSHLKASLVGPSVTILIADGRLQLGTWQGIYYCEFDGPRSRRFFVEIIPKQA